MKQVRQTTILLAAALFLAAALRLAMVLALATYRGDAGAYEHAEIAASLARGDGFCFAFFSDRPLPSSHQAPAIPLLLAAAFGVFGSGSPAAYLALQLINVALGVAATAAAFIVARRLWNERVGLWAAWGMALYLPFLYMATRVQSINWSIGWLFVTLALMLELRAASGERQFPEHTPSTRKPWIALLAIGAGVSAALGMLGEPILLLPLAMFWILPIGEWMAGKPVAWRPWLLAGCAAAVVLAPWTIRNYCVHGRVMAVKSTFWYVFWQGNNQHATGVDKLAIDERLRRRLAWRIGGRELESQLAAARAQAASVDSTLTPGELSELHALPSEVAKVEWFAGRARQWLRENPRHYLALCWRRLAINVWFDPTNPRSYVLPYRLPCLLLAALAVVGLGCSFRVERPRDWLLPALMFAALLLVFTGVITSARFRLVLESLMLLPAALAAAQLTGWLMGSRRRVASPDIAAPPRRMAA